MQKLTWPAVGLIAVLGGVVVALAAFTEFGSGEIIAVLGILGGIGGGAAVGGAVAGRVDQVAAETAAQTPVLQEVAHRVNGDLDRRIAAGAEQAAATVLAELRNQGLIR